MFLKHCSFRTLQYAKYHYWVESGEWFLFPAPNPAHKQFGTVLLQVMHRPHISFCIFELFALYLAGSQAWQQ